MKRLILFIAVISATYFAHGQALTGTKTIKASGGDYSSIASAISALNTNGVGTGGVTFNIDSNFTETAANLTITATGTISNPIIFQKSGTGANPTITAGTGTSTSLDGIILLSGTDYITFDGINLQESSANTTTTTQMEWGYALLKNTVSDGCKNVTIRNCKITLNKTNTATKGIYIANHTTSSTTDLTVADTNGLNSYCKIYNDTITNSYIAIYIRGFAASSSPYTLYDHSNMIGVHGPNTITNFGGGSATVYGIYGIYQDFIKIANNNINGGAGTTTTIYGIFLSTGTSSNVDIYNNVVTLASSATTSQMAGIYNSMGATANNNTVNIYNNTFQNTIYSSSTSAALYTIYNGASATNVNMYNNTITGISLAGSGTFYGIYAGTSTNLNMYNNSVYNNQKTGTSGIMYCSYASTAIVNYYGNRIYNNSIAGGTGAIYGYYNLGSPTYEALYSNKIYNLTHSGTGTVYGIYTYTTSSAKKHIYSDSIYGLSSAGSTIYGIYQQLGDTVKIYNNALFNIASSYGGTTTIDGIYISSGTNVFIYNNFISNIRSTQGTSVTSIYGVYLSTPANTGFYNNTIFLNASSTGSPFGTVGLYASTSYNLDMRNNIIVNISTPSGTGSTIAYRRSSTTLTNYSSLSNNNCFYAGTPGTYRLLFYDGTNSVQSMSAYQALVSPRDNFSFSENPPFTNVSTTPYNIHLSSGTGTQCESGGTAITTPITITTDFDGNARNANFPDVGADEGTFTLTDVFGPSIQYTPLANTPYTSSRTLIATITDPSGVPTSGTGLPKLFWKVNAAGTWTNDTATSIGSNQYSFSFGSSVSVNDTVFYYIVAQDNVSTPNVSCSPSAGAGSLTSSPPAAGTPPTTPNSYKVIPSLSGGNYLIGGTGWTPASGCSYVDLTQAFNDLNNKAVTGAINLILTSNYSSTQDTFPVILNEVYNSSTTNSITIKPDTGIDVNITGSSTSSIIKLNGADFVKIDGSNNNTTSKNLTISNTNTGSSTTAIWIASVSATNGANHNTIKNCIISAGINSSSTVDGIFIGGTSINSAGHDNDNITIQNNNISKAYYGIRVIGTSGYDFDSLQLTDNSIGYATGTTANYIWWKGIELTQVNSSVISNNNIFNIITSATTPIGLSISTGVTNSIITRNNINNITYTGTSGYGGRGMDINTGSSTSNLTIANNVIHTIGGDGWTTFSGSSMVGMYFDGTTGGLNIYYNSVNLSGTFNRSSATLTTAILFNTSTITNINLKNNVFLNSMDNIGSSTDKNYSIYSTAPATSFTSINNNDYFVSGSQGILGFLGSDITNLSGWQSATGSDANSLSSNPQLNSGTDLRPLPSSPLLNAGTPISGITTDINNVTRSSTTPAIGAYENGIDAVGPIITYTPLVNTNSTSAQTLTATIADGFSGVPRNGSGLPRLYWKINSASSFTAATATSAGNDQFTFTFGSSVSVGDTVKYYIVAQDSAATPNVSCSPAAGASGFSYNPPAVSTVPSSLSSYRILATLTSGNYLIGGTGWTPASGCTYVDITQAFNDINNKFIGGPVTLVLTSNYSSAEDTFPAILIANGNSSATNTITLKPASGIDVNISGTSTSSLITLSGADYFVLDGSNNGTNSRNLNITNTATTGTIAALWISSPSSSDGATHNTIKNCNFATGSMTNTSAYVVALSGSTISTTGFNNDFNTLQNNYIKKGAVGITAGGSSTGIFDSIDISGNTIDSMYAYGIYSTYTLDARIRQNTIRNIFNNASTNPAALYFTASNQNAKVYNNEFFNVHYDGTGGYGGKGIYLNSTGTNQNIAIYNNLIYNMLGDGWSAGTDVIAGIQLYSTNDSIKIYNNSINLYGSISRSGATTDVSAALFIGSSATKLDIRNNLLINGLTNTTGTALAYALYSQVANTAFQQINFNDYYVSGTQAMLGYLSSSVSTLAAWRTATGKDVNSINSNPSFTSSTDLHPTAYAINSSGTPISSVPTDYSGTTRHTTAPDAGAYEISFSPYVLTSTDTLVTATTARIQGIVNVKNEINSVATFEFGATSSYGSSINATPNAPSGVNNTTVYADLTGLVPNSTYHYRVKVVNETGTFYGDDSTFNSTSIAPSVTTDVVSSVLSTSAVLNGTVNPNNASSVIGFDFGTSTSYGTTYTADQSPLSNYSDTAVTYTATALIPNTTYHYRVYGTNSFGTSYGADTSFTTPAVVPDVETQSASSVTENSVTLNGMVNANNASSAVTFEWGTTTAYGNTETPSQSPVSGTSNTSVSSDLTGLTPNTTYHYRVVATNTAGTVYGADSTFQTNAIVAVVTTDSASAVTATTATLYGTVNANNASTTATFEYGTSTSYGTTETAPESPVAGTSNTTITSNLTGLTPKTTYHFRASGNNIAGTTNGSDVTFLTTAIAPSVTTDAASSVTATSADLNGTVNANNDATTISIEWGLTTAYGNFATPTPSSLSNYTNTAVSFSLSGLTPNSTYHYRVVATNSGGTSNGADQSFNTTSIAPDATTDYPTAVGDTTATLNAIVNANNDSTTVYFEWGLTTSYGNTLTTTPSYVLGYSNTSISGDLTTILPNSTYHYRVVATNAFGTTYGSDITFSTSSLAPTAYTNAPSSVTKYAATLNGSVNPNNSLTVITFEYGSTSSYGNIDTAYQSPLYGSSPTYVSFDITGLAPNSTYHYRVVASSSQGTTLGNDITFNTPTVLADAVNTGATSVTSTSATMSGTVNPNNTNTVVHFEYGSSTSYGNSVVAPQSPLTGWTTQNVTSSLSNLIPNFTYHYRIKAMNFIGTAYSTDTTFTTVGIPPTATTNAATSVTSAGATLNATINANNSSTVVMFEYGTTTSYGDTVTAYQSPITGYTNSPAHYILTGLLPNTTYHYRVIAINTPGTSYGSDDTFTTNAINPNAVTNTYSSLTSSAVVLNGTVNANNASTTVTFEFGTTTAYGTTVNATPNTVTGTSSTAVSYSFSGLSINTTYHYRVVAVNSAGTSYGSDVSFTTPAVVPTVNSSAATSVTSTSFVMNGDVNANNASTSVVFDWGLTSSYGYTATVAQSPVSGITTTSVSYTLSGLDPNTIYHYRLRGTNAAGTVNGTDIACTTSVVAPTATTNAASSVYSAGATFNGTVNANNSSTSVTFEYGTTTSYGSTVTATQSPVTGLANTAVSYTITSLIPNTTYYFRVVATNAAGTVYGSDQSFSTPVVMPTTSTAAATGITSTDATLNGVANANNASTTVIFQYGTTTTYGSTVTAAQSPVSGTSNTTVSAAISSLTANTTYHFRTVATNSAGTSYGYDMSFLTPAVAPTATTNAATSVAFNGATLNATVNANNATTTVSFEYGTTTSYGSVINAVQSPVSGLSATAVNVVLSALLPNTTYHFRVRATNSTGTIYGSDMSFTQLPL